MTSRIFNANNCKSHLTKSMFLDESVAVARYDELRFPWIDKLTEKQLSFFWRPEEVDLSSDRGQFEALPENEKHIFTSNLKYQILLDSVQGSAPSVCFGSIVSLPELETWIQTWTFSETIHSRSYTHIIRNIYPNPSLIFDEIIVNPQIIERADAVTKEYDNLLNLITEYHYCENNKTQFKKTLELEDTIFRTMVSVNVLEAVRFYVSFACSFAFAERKVMEGNAKVIKLIARDEALHLAGTQRIIQHWINGDDNIAMQQAALRNFNYIEQCFKDAANQEKEWAHYLFKDGSMLGLSAPLLHQYIEYITDTRMKALGCAPIFNRKSNPLPWMSNWLNSDNYQVAPQESEITSYLSGALDSNISDTDFSDLTI